MFLQYLTHKGPSLDFRQVLMFKMKLNVYYKPDHFHALYFCQAFDPINDDIKREHLEGFPFIKFILLDYKASI